MKTLAPEFRALMTNFRSVGPVISTRRSQRSAGASETDQRDARISAVSAGNSGISPASMCCWRRLLASKIWASWARTEWLVSPENVWLAG
jgi:hypothetical protein